MFDSFTTAYIVCALWSSTDDEGFPLDDWATQDDLAEEALQSMAEDCKQFREDNARLLEESELSEEQAGHDFWLTRNGHGAGYWDRGLGAIGQKLTDAAHVWGSSDLYQGDDGKIYIS